MSARYDTQKEINPSQLCVEIGRHPLRHVAGRYVASDAVDEATLAAAVEAHVADPDWTDPDPAPAPEPTDEEKAAVDLSAVRAKAKAVFAGTDTFTAAQVQKLVAALVLRATR